MANKQNTGAWSGILGGLSGGVFFFGLAIAVVFRPLLTGLFCNAGLNCTGGITCFAHCTGSVWRLPGFVFLMGLAILALTGWWWPGILILLGVASILGALNIPGMADFFGLGILSRNIGQPKEEYQRSRSPL